MKKKLYDAYRLQELEQIRSLAVELILGNPAPKEATRLRRQLSDIDFNLTMLEEPDDGDVVPWDAGAYAHFPLLLLAMDAFKPKTAGRPKAGGGQKRKCALAERIIWFTVCHLAEHIMREGPDQPKMRKMKHPPTGYDPTERIHRAVALAMERLGIMSGEVPTIARIRRECASFIDRHSQHSRWLVRLPMGTVLAFRDRPDVNELDLRVLCAVNSCIGNRAYAIVSNDDLARRAVGAECRAAARTLMVTPPSRFQVAKSLGWLQEMGFIHRVLRWKTTFVCRANSMTIEELKMIAENHKKNRKKARSAVLVRA